MLACCCLRPALGKLSLTVRKDPLVMYVVYAHLKSFSRQLLNE